MEKLEHHDLRHHLFDEAITIAQNCVIAHDASAKATQNAIIKALCLWRDSLLGGNKNFKIVELDEPFSREERDERRRLTEKGEQMSQPNREIVTPRNSKQKVVAAITVLTFFNDISDDLFEIIDLVQSNQDLFEGVQGLGKSCVKLAARKLKQVILTERSKQ